MFPCGAYSGRRASSPHSSRLAAATGRPAGACSARHTACVLAFQGKLYTIHVCRLLHAGIVCFRIGLRDCGPVRQYYVNVNVISLVMDCESSIDEIPDECDSSDGGADGVTPRTQQQML